MNFLHNTLKMIVTESKEETKLYILVGGKGTRLSSVTDTPKCLVDIKGKPFIDHLLDTIKGFDITLVCSDLNYGDFEPYKDKGVDVISEGMPSGTAGFMMKVDTPDSFWVMNGDTYYPGDINLDADKSTIFVNKEKTRGDEGYVLVENGKVKKYVEKNIETAGETHLVNVGIYKLYLNDIIFPYRVPLYSTQRQFKIPLSMEYDILPNMDLSYKEVKTDRFDIGTPERLEKFKKWFV